MYTIGRLARRARVKTDTVRFYERQGLLAPTTKTNCGYRLYTDDALRRIALIKHAQRCGFSLAEVRELIGMASGDATSQRYRLVREKQAEIEKTIDALQSMSTALSELLAANITPADGARSTDGANPLVNLTEAAVASRTDTPRVDRVAQARV